ncbi:hypothetical protein [Flavobacterium psychraquaticum]|uniref:hypothetical protein n=1 Tax=Flavobacterium psychraquaticum TaxID=3103958 RepID=UPI002ACD3D4C|nr:hypothetical protein [Flavobacterium sp. LB-N7T]
MKKVIFGLIATIVLTNFSFGQNIKEIGNDKEFQTYIMQSINLNKNLNKEFLTKTFNDKQINENEVEYIYKVFNLKSQEEYKAILLNQDKLLTSLKNKYSFEKYTNEELTDYLSNGISVILSKVDGSTGITPGGNNCRRKYRNDVATIGASAVIGHIGCATLDITVFAGIACHSAVVVIQAAAMDNANIELEECLKG